MALDGAHEAAIAMPLAVARPGHSRLAARYAAPIALIRPDQHVAWCGSALAIPAADLLDRVRSAHSET